MEARVEAVSAGAAVQRLRAVVTHAHGDTLRIEQLAHVVRVHTVNGEGHQARRVWAGSVGSQQAHALDLLHALNQASAQLVFPRFNVLHAQVLQVAHGGGEGDRPARRAGCRPQT